MRIEIKVKTPKQLVNPKKLESEIGKALDLQMRQVYDDFRMTTRTWNTKPRFDKKKMGTSERRVSTENLIYFFVEEGTKPHYITPVRANFLRFRSSYRPKTGVSGGIEARKGGPYGKYVYRKKVRHPGTQARNFRERIVKRRFRGFQTAISAAVLKGLKAK